MSRQGLIPVHPHVAMQLLARGQITFRSTVQRKKIEAIADSGESTLVEKNQKTSPVVRAVEAPGFENKDSQPLRTEHQSELAKP